MFMATLFVIARILPAYPHLLPSAYRIRYKTDRENIMAVCRLLKSGVLGVSAYSNSLKQAMGKILGESNIKWQPPS